MLPPQSLLGETMHERGLAGLTDINIA